MYGDKEMGQVGSSWRDQAMTHEEEGCILPDDLPEDILEEALHQAEGGSEG